MKDYLIKGVDTKANFRFAVVNSKKLVEEARVRHQTSKTATAALGRSLSALSLMASFSLKNPNDSMSLSIKGDGPIGNIVTFSNNKGELKGFVANPQADAPMIDGKLNVAGIVGKSGYIETIMDLGLKDAYTGRSKIISGEIAEDIAAYYYQSEQINTAVSLGVLVDRNLSVKESCGYLIQLMPGVEDPIIDRLEKDISQAPPISSMAERYQNLEDMIRDIVPSFELDFTESRDLTFKCDCSRKKTEDILRSLPKNELKHMLEEDGQAQLVCHYCNEKYDFSRKDLENIISSI